MSVVTYVTEIALRSNVLLNQTAYGKDDFLAKNKKKLQ